MPQHQPPDPLLVARVLELARTGCSATQIQLSLDVPRSTITRWVRAASAATEPEARTTSEAISAAVANLGDKWTIAGAAEIAEVTPDMVRIWLRSRVDAVLLRRGLPLDAVRPLLQFSGMHV